MSDTTVSQIHWPIEDALTAVLKRGAEELLAKAVKWAQTAQPSVPQKLALTAPAVLCGGVSSTSYTAPGD